MQTAGRERTQGGHRAEASEILKPRPYGVSGIGNFSAVITLMRHLVLLGDSIFDNAAYVKGGLDVISHLRQQIPRKWQASLRAVDGSMIENVRDQILGVPDGATHLIKGSPTRAGRLKSVGECVRNTAASESQWKPPKPL